MGDGEKTEAVEGAAPHQPQGLWADPVLALCRRWIVEDMEAGHFRTLADLRECLEDARRHCDTVTYIRPGAATIVPVPRFVPPGG